MYDLLNVKMEYIRSVYTTKLKDLMETHIDTTERGVSEIVYLVFMDPLFNTHHILNRSTSTHVGLSKEDMESAVDLGKAGLSKFLHAVVFCSFKQFQTRYNSFEILSEEHTKHDEKEWVLRRRYVGGSSK